ncbi:TetR family transcriptional regulator [Streptomyces sp. NPDC008150]|uniref:TetR/AcrR family transcriptional regulator n=1 Tax=Streptomyces sp. NPDC008150 TaxID=3364816 RepID=UPI0036E4CEFA
MTADAERRHGRRRDADATRAALLRAARDLFGLHGYEAVTLRDIGERAGADASLIARYFGNKAALYRSAVAEDGREVPAAPPVFDLTAYTAQALRRVDERGTPGPLVQSLVSQGGAPEAREAAANDVRTRLIDPLVDHLTAEGVPDPDGTAETLVACLMGVIAMRPGGLFPALTRADPETVGALLHAAARSAVPFLTRGAAEDVGETPETEGDIDVAPES